MPPFHSTLESSGKSYGNIALMPLRQTSKGTARGPSPVSNEEDIVDQMAQLSVDGAVGGLAQADGAVGGRRRPRSPSKLKKCVNLCPCIPACAVVSRCQCDPPPDTPCVSAFSCKRYSQVNLSNLQKKSLIFHHDLKRIYLRLPERLNLRK